MKIINKFKKYLTHQNLDFCKRCGSENLISDNFLEGLLVDFFFRSKKLAYYFHCDDCKMIYTISSDRSYVFIRIDDYYIHWYKNWFGAMDNRVVINTNDNRIRFNHIPFDITKDRLEKLLLLK
jgi:hypothetical protein